MQSIGIILKPTKRKIIIFLIIVFIICFLAIVHDRSYSCSNNYKITILNYIISLVFLPIVIINKFFRINIYGLLIISEVLYIYLLISILYSILFKKIIIDKFFKFLLTIMLLFLLTISYYLNIFIGNNCASDVTMSVKIKEPEKVSVVDYLSFQDGYVNTIENSFLIIRKEIYDNKGDYKKHIDTNVSILVDKSISNFLFDLSYVGVFGGYYDYEDDANISIQIYGKDNQLLAKNKGELQYSVNYKGFDRQKFTFKLIWRWFRKHEEKITIHWLDHDEFEKHKIEYLHNNLSKLLPTSNQIIKNNTSLDLENIKLECSYKIDQESKTITTTLPFQLLGKKEKSFSYSDLGLENDSKNTTNLKCEVVEVEIVEE